MLCDLVVMAQKGDKDAMLELINKFTPLLKKYAVKLGYEDADADIVLYYIELIKAINLSRLTCQNDEVIVSYINRSIINFYKKGIKKRIEAKREILLSELTEEQVYCIEAQNAKRDKYNLVHEIGMKEILNQTEYQLICLIYYEGYTTAEIARIENKSRQAVNQLKQRALKKLERAMGA